MLRPTASAPLPPEESYATGEPSRGLSELQKAEQDVRRLLGAFTAQRELRWRAERMFAKLGTLG